MPLNLSSNLLLSVPPSPSGIETEMDKLPHLTADHAHGRQDSARDYRDAQAAKTAAAAIGGLPTANASIHMILSGRFSLFDFIPAVAELAGVGFDAVTIATLGFSRRNVEGLCAMVDVGKAARVRMLCSHYFSGTSTELYQLAVKQFNARKDRMEFFSVRTHAKLLMLALRDGRRVTIESSANLRSCKNIEQASAFGDPALYDFHCKWINELFQAGASNGK